MREHREERIEYREWTLFEIDKHEDSGQEEIPNLFSLDEEPME